MNQTRTQPIELWHAASSSREPGVMERCCQNWLSADENERAKRFRVATSRNQHVVGRGMARRLLGRERVDPQSVEFGFETHGKPYVVQPPAAQQPFNVAHTDGLVMCGIGSSAHTLLGVDVERLGRRTDPALAERYFSKPEIEILRGERNEQTRRDRFLQIWTLKESFIKAIGTGLTMPLADFAFRDLDAAAPTIELLNPELDNGARWKFFSLRPRPGYVAAVAVALSDQQAEVEVQLQDFETLVSGPQPVP